MTVVSYPGHPDTAARETPPAAVLFDLYDTLVHARAGSYFYHSVPTALGVEPERWLIAYRALGRAAITGAVPDMITRVHLACRDAGHAVVMSYAVGVLKPDPHIYHAALGLLGVAPAAAVFVGDGGDGELGGAKQLGLRTVLVERGLPHTKPARADADFRCRDLSGVAALLLAAS